MSRVRNDFQNTIPFRHFIDFSYGVWMGFFGGNRMSLLIGRHSEHPAVCGAAVNGIVSAPTLTEQEYMTFGRTNKAHGY
jgi:hypothetical protein